MRKNKLISKFSMFELLIIAMMAAAGIATKPIIVPLVQIITGPLFIPGGSIAGGFYMMWIVIAMGIVRKIGTGFLTGIVQAILVIAMGMFGTHGIVSLISYTLPGIAVDMIFLFSKNRNYNILHYMFAGAFANLTGTYMSNVVFFRLPLIPLLFSLSSAALSGCIGGLIANSVINKIGNLGILNFNN